MVSGLHSNQYTLVLTWTLVALECLQIRAFKFQALIWIQDPRGRSCEADTRPDSQGLLSLQRLGPDRQKYPEVPWVYCKSPMSKG